MVNDDKVQKHLKEVIEKVYIFKSTYELLPSQYKDYFSPKLLPTRGKKIKQT
ncbi:74_t:CDS:2 [Cetraspora pellucida]|uniref:74_t:CDS:1 n=1 Tax=Cetraspora pellucida TaxID=1433469 RepID=A0A9N8VMM6_9GLOM|nr:74_t:CDS:2 [Cetraspora pellucida]